MIRTIEDFYTEAKQYVTLFNIFAEKCRLIGRAQADHICYKCGDRESFEHIRAMFETGSDYIYQSVISKRRIACVRLKESVNTCLGSIGVLELSDQKPDGSQHEGFDHIEAYPISFSYDEMIQELETTEKVIKVERPHHTTHDIEIAKGFLFRCTHGPLIEKIKAKEMI